METSYQRIAREQRERQEARAKRYAESLRKPRRQSLRKPRRQCAISNRIADRIDGYDRDDLGESPDF